jgi:hypothetical protein
MATARTVQRLAWRAAEARLVTSDAIVSYVAISPVYEPGHGWLANKVKSDRDWLS